MKEIYSLDFLLGFDPGATRGDMLRMICPACGDSKPKDTAHRCFILDDATGKYYCHRCNIKGVAGKTPEQAARPVKPRAPKKPTDVLGMLSRSEPGYSTWCGASKYLTGRGLSQESIMALDSEVLANWFGGKAVVFAIRDRARKLVAVQGRYIDPKPGELKARSYGPVSTGVFSTPGALDGDVITICEAPIDAISLHEFGFPAVATCGSAMCRWLINLCRGKSVYFAFDNDNAGWAMSRRWADRIGHGQSYYAPQGKDWNEYLCIQKGIK